MAAMGTDIDRLLRELANAQEFARTYRFRMTDDYRALIGRVEAMSENQPGADKSAARSGNPAESRAFLSAFSPLPTR